MAVAARPDETDRVRGTARFDPGPSETAGWFQQLFDASPDAIVLLDPHDPEGAWPIVDCNRAACAMNGYPRETLIGSSIDTLNTTVGTRPERDDYLRRLRREGVITIETFHRHADGHVFPVEVSTTLVSFADRELVLGIDRDITDRKRTEEALKAALEAERRGAERLRELDEMKNTILTAVSHDLRTPLTSVLGSALTLQRLRATLSDPEQDDLIAAITSNAGRLQRMLSDLLDLDRLTRGVLEPVLGPTNLPGLIRYSVEESGLLEDHPVQIDVEPMIAELDGPKVERIVGNLLVNARRHTLGGTPIWISARPASGGVLILVEDAGPGVPEEMREAVFEPFHRLAEPSPHAPGVGAGLALVKRFAELHHGRAWVEERVGGGASFRVFLPAAVHPA